jgi:ABC-type transporter MlaC component
MKTTILRVLLLLGFCTTALLSRAQTTAADSLAERKLIQSLSTDMCQQLEQENKKKPLRDISQAEAQQLFVRIFTKSVSDDEALMQKFEALGPGARAYGEKLGRGVGITLLQECPVSQPLLMRLGGEQANKEQALQPKEVAVLKPIATAMCRDLQPRVAELKKMTPEQRLQELTQAFQKNLKPFAKEITQFYGADVFLDPERMKALGTKISFQMAGQCPEVVLLFADMDKTGK